MTMSEQSGKIKYMKCRYDIRTLIVMVILGLTPSHMAFSTSMPTCNSDVLGAMENRAWLEAQREITQNQNLITKPDSVLEYTCFDQFLDVLADGAEEMFSENTSAWSGTPALVTSSDMDDALTEIAASPLDTYINNNFDHSYRGGRGPSNVGISDTINGGNYTCEEMDRVWRIAKCDNFAAVPTDSFLTFSQHESSDPRVFPSACGADPRWGSVINYVYGSPGWDAAFESTQQAVANTFQEYTEGGSCSGSRLIKTGLEYVDEAGTDIEDSICLNPGCYFNGSGCISVP